ncbi:MAG: DUF5666 domain-containing protein [Rhodoferax sp.]|nr:DUF5666 domain-containing protein [Rhodoferax sp.]
MKYVQMSTAPLTRRHWLMLTGAALTGCGGGGDLLGALPGTGGTGTPMFSQGTISGFGSVIINGIKFDDSLASVRVDGVSVGTDVLRLGMVAGVRGERNAADAGLGTASSIEVWSIAQGLVTRVGANSDFDVMGMTIQTDANTSLDGVSSLTALAVGQFVTVWGLQAGGDAAQWMASRVAVQADGGAVRVSTGLVKHSDETGTTTVNRWKLVGTVGASLQEEQLVRVQGTPGADQSLNLSDAKVLSSGFDENQQGNAEVEGVVTSVPSGMRFTLGSITVDASAPALATVLGQLSVGRRVEVYGQWSGTVLAASAIKYESVQNKPVELNGRIEQLTSVSNFVIRGQRCDASGITLGSSTAAGLKVGVRVKVTGSKAGDVLTVASLTLVGNQ